jgi:hypothetical protein
MAESLIFTSVPATNRRRRGSALVSTMVVFTGIAGLTYATTLISAVDVRASRAGLEQVRTGQLAQAGLEQGLHFLGQAVDNSAYQDPIAGLAGLFASASTIYPYTGQTLMDGVNNAGAYTVSMTLDEATSDTVTVTLEATGYLPDAPQNLAPGETVQSWSATSTTVRYSLAPSGVFDSGYFINNWGWFYGNTIECNGNARSNGQFDAAGYSPSVNGQPIYESVSMSGGNASLSGYQDTNGDGLEDGNDGGVFSGWDIVGAQNIQGVGGDPMNQHDFQDQVEMPNLSDLGAYEKRAITEGATVTVGGNTITGVYGDDPSELGNLYLVGTLADPVVINGALVVKGDVIISGYVTGQGAIYAGGNVYVPDSVVYVDPPTTDRPTSNTQADTEQWLSDNWNKDFLGLFATENVVVGDHTNGTWQYYVNWWMDSSMNRSDEDAGQDGIPNTLAGKDGILGTADDDVLEDDGLYTVETYTAADEALGLIPPGKNVGDVIPGSGEDIDGDGAYDDATTYANDMAFDAPLDTANWGGNMPVGGIANYSDIANLYASELDATFYTNHAFAWVVLGSQTAKINGAVISRNESIIYGTPTIEINYDCRLLGGNTGMAGDLLPRVVQPVEVLRWSQLDADPNFYLVVE